MTHQEIRNKFLKFFESRGHKIVPSSSLIPTDPSVLFTTAGMQQFKNYYTNPEQALAKNVVSIQKCLRTSDIDEVGDKSHLTFFEMLGNFSFGGYWKKEAIELAHEFITKELGLKIDYISIFSGSGNIPRDTESVDIWKSVDSNIKIIESGLEDNFWGRTGDEGPCGPTTELYVQGIEIWNIVFNQYYSKKKNNIGNIIVTEELPTKGIDTGMGLERLAVVVQNKKNIFETDLFTRLVEFLPQELPERVKRIIVDHARGATFLLADGVRPSNKEAGYVLRRLLRRVFVYQHLHNLRPDTLEELMKIVFENYGDIYPELIKNRNETINAMWGEYEKFNKTVGRGIKELEKLEKIDASSAFILYESYGLPYEIIKELGGERAISLTHEAFNEEFKKHQEKSRAGAEKKFGGHGLLMDTGELKAGNEDELKKATRLHTATHLLHAALRKVLDLPAGGEVKQAGSDITAERLRFDFTFPRKLTPEELKQVEDLVNEAVKKDSPVTKEEMAYEDALKSGAMAFFKLKYPPRVNVYSVGDFSKELCGGPHVSHTAEIGKFKITKEEAVSAGVRRIRAVVK